MKKIKTELIEENGKVYEVTTWESRRELRGEALGKQLADLIEKQNQLKQMKAVVDEAEQKEKARKEQEEKERKEKEEKEKKPE